MKDVYYEDVNIGDDLPALEKTITKEQILDYADASGDYHPIHVNDEFAEKAGLGGIVAHGFLTFTFIMQLMTDWLPDPMDLKKIGAGFVGMVKSGDNLIRKGKVRINMSEME